MLCLTDPYYVKITYRNSLTWVTYKSSLHSCTYVMRKTHWKSCATSLLIQIDYFCQSYVYDYPRFLTSWGKIVFKISNIYAKKLLLFFSSFNPIYMLISEHMILIWSFTQFLEVKFVDMSSKNYHSQILHLRFCQSNIHNIYNFLYFSRWITLK